jgi:tight adherence protein B
VNAQDLALPLGVAALTFTALAAASEVLATKGGTDGLLQATREPRQQLREAVATALSEGRIDRTFGGRRLLLASILSGALFGFILLGFAGVVVGAAALPLTLRWVLRSRRRRYASQIDACAADLAQAMASSLAAGRSVRGALLTVSNSTPDPLAAELRRAAVDLTLGGSIGDALTGLIQRTGSPRLDSLAGAIELHRGSGGDLVKLMRELAAAFRERDRAMKDAHSASAQARFTAYVVAAIPLGVAVLLEIVAPGSVTGAMTLLPTAMMLALSALLIFGGTGMAVRLGSVRT